jgi:hypothetical protein
MSQLTTQVTAQAMLPAAGVTVGLDIGDRFSHFHALDRDGASLEEGQSCARRGEGDGRAPARVLDAQLRDQSRRADPHELRDALRPVVDVI